WSWTMSNSRDLRSANVMCRSSQNVSPIRSLGAVGKTASSRARVWESPEAKRVTSCPSATSPSASRATTRSMPPYASGGTGNQTGQTRPTFTRAALGRAVDRRAADYAPSETATVPRSTATVHVRPNARTPSMRSPARRAHLAVAYEPPDRERGVVRPDGSVVIAERAESGGVARHRSDPPARPERLGEKLVDDGADALLRDDPAPEEMAHVRGPRVD